MKKYFVILLSLLLVLSACGGDEPESNDEPLEDQWEDIINETESDCPVCETCDVCEECEEAVCDEMMFDGEHIELWLDQLELYSTEQGSTEDVTVAKIETDEFDRLKTATLRFTPDCVTSDTLRVRWESEEIYEREPVCGEEVTIALSLGNVDLGRNNVVFTSFGEEDYTVGDIELDLTLINGINLSKPLFEVRFTPSELERDPFKTLSDVEIVNFVEHELDLDAEEASEDYVLSFNGEDREGGLRILVNSEEVFNGVPARHLNEVTIPASELRKGTNYITFVGVAE
ncbi:hypothetical protein GOV07_00825 [Candidatus Woesearchaeota archaeon]|nr:hypothetical protein [Candidatus Woesearchaeota archaeon]